MRLASNRFVIALGRGRRWWVLSQCSLNGDVQPVSIEFENMENCRAEFFKAAIGSCRRPNAGDLNGMLCQPIDQSGTHVVGLEPAAIGHIGLEPEINGLSDFCEHLCEQLKSVVQANIFALFVRIGPVVELNAFSSQRLVR